MWDRPLRDTFIKWVIVFICTAGLLKDLFLSYNLYRGKVSWNRLLVFFVITEISLYTSYLSFIPISQTNVFKTVAFPGNIDCMSGIQAKLEIVRFLIFFLSDKLTHWLALFLGLANVNHKFTVSVVHYIHELSRLCIISPIKLVLCLAFIMLLSMYSTVFFIAFNPYLHSELNQTCYDWDTSRKMTSHSGQIILDIIVEILPYALSITCCVVIFVKARRQSSFRRATVIASRLVKRRQGVCIENIKLIDIYVIDILVQDLVLSLPEITRHFMQVTDTYHIKSFLDDEKFCDVIDALLLINTNFVVIVYYKMIVRLDVLKAKSKLLYQNLKKSLLSSRESDTRKSVKFEPDEELKAIESIPCTEGITPSLKGELNRFQTIDNLSSHVMTVESTFSTKNIKENS